MKKIRVSHFLNLGDTKKQFFLKFTTFSTSTAGDIYTNLLACSKSLVKTKVRSDRTFFVIFLMSVVICKRFSLEMRLCKTFKTTNAMILTETILENSYKFYKDHEKYQLQNGPYNFQKPFNFKLLLTFEFLCLLSSFDQSNEFPFFINCI